MLHLTQILFSALCPYNATLISLRSLSGMGWRQPKIVYKYIKFQTKLPQTQQQQKIQLYSSATFSLCRKLFILPSSSSCLSKWKNSTVISNWKQLNETLAPHDKEFLMCTLCSTFAYFVASKNCKREEEDRLCFGTQVSLFISRGDREGWR